jgi:hypothetical protein
MRNASGGVDVFHNPDLYVPNDPSWFAWAEQVQKDKAAGKIPYIMVGQEPLPASHPEVS